MQMDRPLARKIQVQRVTGMQQKKGRLGAKAKIKWEWKKLRDGEKRDIKISQSNDKIRKILNKILYPFLCYQCKSTCFIYLF